MQALSDGRPLAYFFKNPNALLTRLHMSVFIWFQSDLILWHATVSCLPANTSSRLLHQGENWDEVHSSAPAESDTVASFGRVYIVRVVNYSSTYCGSIISLSADQELRNPKRGHNSFGFRYAQHYGFGHFEWVLQVGESKKKNQHFLFLVPTIDWWIRSSTLPRNTRMMLTRPLTLWRGARNQQLAVNTATRFRLWRSEVCAAYMACHGAAVQCTASSEELRRKWIPWSSSMVHPTLQDRVSLESRSPR